MLALALLSVVASASGEVPRAEGKATAEVAARPPLALAFVPFGVGQFANGDVVKGRFFLISEVLAFGTAAGSYAVYASARRGYTPDGRAIFDNPEWANQMQILTVSSLVVGTALTAGGIFEALVGRNRGPNLTLRPTPNGLLVLF